MSRLFIRKMAPLLILVVVFCGCRSFSSEIMGGAYRINMQRDGDFKTKYPEKPSEILWSFKIDKNLLISQPVVGDGIICFRGLDKNKNGYIYCIDIEKGNLIYKLKGDSLSEPTIYKERLYYGDNQGYFHCANVMTGEEMWFFKTMGGIINHPVIVDGNIYLLEEVSSEKKKIYDTFLYRIALEKGNPKISGIFSSSFMDFQGLGILSTLYKKNIVFSDSGGVVRNYNTESEKNGFEINTNMCILNIMTVKDVTVVSSRDRYGRNYIYLMEPYFGMNRWSKELTGEEFISMSCGNGDIYTLVKTKTGTRLYAFEINSGNEKWKLDFNDNRLSEIIKVGNRLYIGGDNYIYCIDANKKSIDWIYDTNDGVRSLIPYEGRIYYISDDGYLYCVK